MVEAWQVLLWPLGGYTELETVNCGECLTVGFHARMSFSAPTKTVLGNVMASTPSEAEVQKEVLQYGKHEQDSALRICLCHNESSLLIDSLLVATSIFSSA